jgi:hypothetical protein
VNISRSSPRRTYGVGERGRSRDQSRWAGGFESRIVRPGALGSPGRRYVGFVSGKARARRWVRLGNSGDQMEGRARWVRLGKGMARCVGFVLGERSARGVGFVLEEDHVPCSRTEVVRVPRVRYSDPVRSGWNRRHGVGVPNPWHPALGSSWRMGSRARWVRLGKRHAATLGSSWRTCLGSLASFGKMGLGVVGFVFSRAGRTFEQACPDGTCWAISTSGFPPRPWGSSPSVSARRWGRRASRRP